MKQSLIKLDTFFLNQLTAYIRNWISNRNFKKHKVDFMIKAEWVDFFVLIGLAVVIPATFNIIEGKFVVAGLHITIWGTLVALRYWHIKSSLADFKRSHDYSFSMRKNPEYYKMNKEILEEMFIRGRRNRIQEVAFITCLEIVIFALIAGTSLSNFFIGEYLLISVIFSTIQRYCFYVFDFDEPQPKKKKKRVSLTNLAMKAWREMLAGISPAPVHAYQKYE